MSFAMAIGAESSGVLYGISTVFGEKLDVVDFQIWSLVRTSNEGCWLLAPFAYAICPLQNFGDHVRIAIVNHYGCRS